MDNRNIKIYEFDHFKSHADIVHAVFARPQLQGSGGNTFLDRESDMGDTFSPVVYNRERIKDKLGMKSQLFLNQVHGTQIKVLKKADNDLHDSCSARKDAYTADAVITDIKDLLLVILVADCQAVLLYDPENKVIANIHSGWRGSTGNIIGACVARMTEEFSCRPGNISAGISPSLGPCCAEFVNYRKEIPERLWKYKVENKDYFDFWKMSCDQLLERGVRKENIENMGICTKCNMNEFYSFRGEKTGGRFACLISMI